MTYVDLNPVRAEIADTPETGILFSFEENLALVDWIARSIRSDKRGHIR
ncbi:MAG: hypothetical protein GY785_18795 [Gammaproteobacteria bacterium]|nr:hypothetical protein [Gammaproteobacteria bacterium]